MAKWNALVHFVVRLDCGLAREVNKGLPHAPGPSPIASSLMMHADHKANSARQGIPSQSKVRVGSAFISRGCISLYFKLISFYLVVLETEWWYTGEGSAGSTSEAGSHSLVQGMILFHYFYLIFLPKTCFVDLFCHQIWETVSSPKMYSHFKVFMLGRISYKDLNL